MEAVFPSRWQKKREELFQKQSSELYCIFSSEILFVLEVYLDPSSAARRGSFDGYVRTMKIAVA